MNNQQRPVFNPSKMVPYATMGFIALVVLLVISSSTFLTIDPGHKGVMFKPLGQGVVTDKIYGEGFHILWPWDDMIKYDIRLNEGSEEMEVLSKNGLNIKVELTYRYQPNSESLGFLHQEIGPTYNTKIIIPEIRSATREVIGKYLPEELYSSQREAIQDEIEARTRAAVETKHIKLDAILIREVVLPESLQAAIERKLKEEQASLEYEFRLDRERKEAERRIIEAKAKAEANRVLNASLSVNILKDKGIEATLELAKSPNSKVVIVGGADEGLPLILNN